MNNFLIPANSKKSMLIFGLFTTFDLILFGCGLGTTLFLMMLIPVEKLTNVIIVMMPLAATAFLVMPVPNYHNVFTILKTIWEFYTTRQGYYWKGWCFLDDKESKK